MKNRRNCYKRRTRMGTESD